MLDLQPHHLAGPQPTAITETEQHPDPEASGERQQAPRLVRTHHQRNLLWLTQVIDLACEVQPPQRHPQQELQSGHDAIAVADAQPGLRQVQLKPANIVGRGRVGGAPQKGSEPFAGCECGCAANATQACAPSCLDHALAQRADRLRTHGKLLSRMRLNTSILKTGRYARYRWSLPRSPAPQTSRPLQRAIAQRFSALALCVCTGVLLSL
jgi:hypothetical protein